MGNMTPRTPLEFLVQENNRLVTNLISASGGSSTATTAAVTSVASSTSSVQLLASNTNRVEAVVTNSSNYPLLLKLGASASYTSFSIIIGTNESVVIDKFNGAVHGIWGSAHGSAMITETT